VQCRCERGGVDAKPGDKLISSCGTNHLQEEIWTVNPEIVVLAGATACSLVGVNLELEHGFPRMYTGDGLWGWSGVVVPMFHPAAGMHETRYMTPLLEDWRNLGRWLRGEWTPPTPPTEPLDYRLIERPEELDELC
jgi:uracil-DNA glycosylase